MTQPNTVKSLEKTIRIVETLRDVGPAGVTELSHRLEMPRSTVQVHLNSLYESEYLVKTADGEYRLGLRFLGLGEATRHDLILYKAASPEIVKLASQTGELANLLVEEHGRGIYLSQAAGDNAVTLDTHPGKRVYLHCTSLGNSILAHLPEDELNAIIKRHGLPSVTAKTVTDEDTLRERLTNIAERGYAFDEGERHPGIRCVAAPILKDDDVLGAVSVSGPAGRMQGERFREQLPEQVTNTTNLIEIKVTYS